METRYKFDERQLKIRGDVFQHAFIFTLAALLANAFITSRGILWAEGMWPGILIVVFAITFCSIEMILREVYVTGGGRLSPVPLVLGGLGLVVMVLGLVHLAGGRPLAVSGHLTTTGVNLLVGLCFAAIGAAYVGKRAAAKCRRDDEE